MSMVSLPAGEVSDLREAAKERDLLLGCTEVQASALRLASGALHDIFAAINLGTWEIVHDDDCPEDDTCDCPGGIQGTAGLANHALNVVETALGER